QLEIEREAWMAGTSPAMTMWKDAAFALRPSPSRTSRAQRRADALRRCGKLVDRDAKRRQRVVDGVDNRCRRADRPALAQPLGLGDRRLRPGLEMMNVDR